MGKETSYTEVKKLVMNGTSYTEVEDIAEKFNEFFTNIATQLDAQLPQSDASPYASMPPPHPSSFYLFPVTEQECLKIILSIKNSKTNNNEMPVHIFKSISDYIIKPLVNIMNRCFNSGVFPNCLKIGRVTQIFKSGERSDPANYRPISTLPYLSKIFETCLRNRLVNFFEKYSRLSKFQFGFRSGMSTSDALIELTNYIYDSLNAKKYHACILIDYRKAFDTISHHILIKKLHMYGIRGIPLRLIQNYLSDRKQFVRIGKVSSTVE